MMVHRCIASWWRWEPHIWMSRDACSNSLTHPYPLFSWCGCSLSKIPRWWLCLLVQLAGLISRHQTPSWHLLNLWSSWSWLKTAHLIILWDCSVVPQPALSLTQTPVTQPAVTKQPAVTPKETAGLSVTSLSSSKTAPIDQGSSCPRARQGCPHDHYSARSRSPFRMNSLPSRFSMCLFPSRSPLDIQFKLVNHNPL